MSGPRPPIFVDEHGDIEAYPSVDAAALDVEAIDVAAGEYTVFDAQAHPSDRIDVVRQVLMYGQPTTPTTPESASRPTESTATSQP